MFLQCWMSRFTQIRIRPAVRTKHAVSGIIINLLYGLEVIGVSTDDEKSHQKFVTKYELPFTLISDTDKKIVEAYGVWVEKNMYGKKYMGTARKTFLIGPDGTLKKIIEKVDTKNSSQQVLDLV